MKYDVMRVTTNAALMGILVSISSHTLFVNNLQSECQTLNIGMVNPSITNDTCSAMLTQAPVPNTQLLYAAAHKAR